VDRIQPDGARRWLETDTALADNSKELTWGFSVGDIRTKSTLHLTDAGEWTDVTARIGGYMDSGTARRPPH